MGNQYAEHNPRCCECENCEDIPGSQRATCQIAADTVTEAIGIRVEVRFNPDQDARHCDDFDPDAEFFERVREESTPKAELYGLTPPSGITIAAWRKFEAASKSDQLQPGGGQETVRNRDYR